MAAPRADTTSSTPKLVVFDLDACLWDKEMYMMSSMPTGSVSGALGDAGEGVVGVYSGSDLIKLFPGSLVALQEYASGAYPGMRLAAASSADTPFAVQVGTAALKTLEVVPGKTVWDVFAMGWPEGHVAHMQIGRSPPLSSNKAQTHFPILREATGIRYDDMLFFDDSYWSDHCGIVSSRCKEADTGAGVVARATPTGMTEGHWRAGLELFAKAKSKQRA